ncbi:murein hydrolase activator EnvC family protein [Pararhodobacter aggregans]|uniref:Peptidase M23 n=1 Tax=Pararhodobacter aggregans TaxID=404875 RepID=A0A2T7UNV6_9RHOB|nr:peptidoglycan DD-metalloendopeptidase family protein [Pararhodobacter aggregans]PTX00819.1 septal ring factor EnvC (AmiA/AmiB activator) [Pararhodobacter aggregans]PVE46347.1 peptidase M23 [Pararhodobacter aggregans]
MRIARILALLACLAAPAPAVADTAGNAQAAAIALLNAIDSLAEARRAPDQVAALTQAIQAHEAGLSALREGLREAALREASINRVLEQQQAQVSRILGAMMAVERIEGPVMLVHPQGPLATARAGMMIADVAAGMQAEADRIGALARELAALRELRETAVDTLAAGLASLQGARAELSQAMADRRDLPPRVGDDETRMLALLESVRTLQDLATGLATRPSGASAELPIFDTARGRLPMPVIGTQLRAFGEADAAGITRPGLVVATEPGALVTAPWYGTVRYRGPLLDYGNVVLLEPGEGWLIVLAGLDLVYPRQGEVVAQGDALGLMPGGATGADEFVQADQVAGRSETLYLELRQDGQAIDPADWFDLSGEQRP